MNTKTKLSERINLKDFEENTDENTATINNLLSDTLFEQYKGIVEISDFNRKTLDSKFKDSYGIYMSGKISIPSDPEIKYKEYIFKQYNSHEKYDEVKTNLKFINSIISEESSWPWGGPGDPKAKLFEEVYATEYDVLKENNILCLEGIFAPSVRDKFEKIKSLNSNEEWQLEKPLDPIILLQEWAYSKIGGKEKINELTPIKDFDYSKFFDTAFEGMQILYSVDEKAKDYAKESLEKLRGRYFDKKFDTIIHLGYPRRNRSRSLVNPDGLCLGPRALNLGCYYGDPTVFNRIEEYETIIGKSIDALIKKRGICRKAFGFHNLIGDIDKEILENGTYFGSILANFYAVGKQKEISEQYASEYRQAIENQTARLVKEADSLSKKWKEFLEVYKK